MENLLSTEDSKAVIGILTHELDVQPSQLTPEARLEDDLGADSLTLVQIHMALEDHFNLTIPDERSGRIRTVEDVFELIAENLEQRR